MTVRILLVDDDPVSRDIIGALLATRGYRIDAVDDGFRALRFMQDASYDLIFVDYHLPDLDGYALARLMRTLAEKTGSKPRIVAITADRFGLAARRGSDAVFDRLLSKPIEANALFACADALLTETNENDELESFLSEPSSNDAQNAAQVLWRVRGFSTLPVVAPFPTPSPTERAKLEYCFRLAEPDVADCLVLVSRDGLPEVERLRETGESYLQPLIGLDQIATEAVDASFKVGDGDSWSAAGTLLKSFQARRAHLKPAITSCEEIETRLAAYLYVADRPLILRRDSFGRTTVPYSGGFGAKTAIESVKRLAAKSMVVTKPHVAGDDGVRELVVSLTTQALAALTNPRAAMSVV